MWQLYFMIYLALAGSSICCFFSYMITLKLALFSSLSLLAVSCSPSVEDYSIPSNYSGALATIEDTYSTKGVRGYLYTVSEINGKRDTVSAFKYVYGGGAVLEFEHASRKIPAERTLVTISAGNVYNADGVALLDSMAGGCRSVSGDIIITPRAGRVYQVKGDLKNKPYSVWLEDKSSGKLLGEKVYSK